jgi:hypothetical protein
MKSETREQKKWEKELPDNTRGETDEEQDRPLSGIKTWLTTILCVSIWNLVSSWTKRSVSNSDKNSGIQTQTKVVFSCEGGKKRGG